MQNVELEIDTTAATVTGNADFFKDLAAGDAYDRDTDALIQAQVYTVYDKDNYVIGAIVLGDVSGSGDYAYITSAGAVSEEKIGDTYYWEFEAIFDGEFQTLTAKSKYTEIINTIEDYQWNTLELRFDPDGYVVRVVPAEDVYRYEQAIDEDVDIDKYDVYLVQNVVDDFYNGYTGDLELNLQDRTLYVIDSDAVNTDMGLALASDAKAVVIQDENRKSNVKTEFTSVRAAISHLVDADDSIDGMQYEGKIFAVLNSNGSAAWIVFDSDTPLITGEGGIITGSQNVIWNGNVGLWGDDANTDVDGISFNPSTDRVNYSFFLIDAAGNKLGNRDVTYDVDVYVNGQRVSSSVDDVENVSNSRGLVSGELYVAAEADDVVEVVIHNVAIAGITPEPGEAMTVHFAKDAYLLYADDSTEALESSSRGTVSYVEIPAGTENVAIADGTDGSNFTAGDVYTVNGKNYTVDSTGVLVIPVSELADGDE